MINITKAEYTSIVARDDGTVDAELTITFNDGSVYVETFNLSPDNDDLTHKLIVRCRDKYSEVNGADLSNL